MFESKAIINYLNDLVMHLVGRYMESIELEKFNEAAQMSPSQPLNKTQMLQQLKFVGIDTSFYFLSQLFNNKSMEQYLEPLTGFDDNSVQPIISRTFGLEYFYLNKEKRNEEQRTLPLSEQFQET